MDKIYSPFITKFILPWFFLLSMLIIGLSLNVRAQTVWDTIHIQTFTFGSSQDSFFVFPPDTIRYEKALMRYKLKCNPAKNPACGQWDYLTYTYLKQYTHTYDTAGVEIINRFEIARYITPYGINLSLGNGFTWTYDVSDYVTLLHDTVYLSAGNGQELLDVSFELIKGIPPRDPVKIENIWNAHLNYDGIQNTLTAKSIYPEMTAQNFRYKMRTTGHGFGGNDNCSEFCPRHHFLTIDGIQRWDTLVWRNNCSFNPVYPQGGTWIYNRSNWCPGAEVATYDFELTPYITPGDSATLLYTIDPYTWNGVGTTPSYVIETQLVSYKAPNFRLDAAVKDIKAPSTADIYKRMNPICSQPVITIQNTGTTTLTSLTITYELEGGQQSVYNWTGNLDFLQTQDVTLPPFAWSRVSNLFKVTVSDPDGGTDQYPNNNSMESVCNLPPQYVNDLVFDLLTSNHSDVEDSYTVKDANGNIVFQRNNLSNNTLYRDTLHLDDGCYEFKLEDDWGITNPEDPGFNQGDGMYNWPDTTITVGHMFIRKASTGQVLKNFGMDFGHELFQQFTIGFFVGVQEQKFEDVMAVYPNPSKGVFNLDMSFSKEQDIAVAVYDIMGRSVFSASLKNASIENKTIDLTGEPNGLYIITIQMKDKILTKRLVKEN